MGKLKERRGWSNISSGGFDGKADSFVQAGSRLYIWFIQVSLSLERQTFHLPLAADMDEEQDSAIRRSQRTRQISVMLNSEEVYAEKLRAPKNTQTGQLSAISCVRGSIEALMDNAENVATVREHLS